MGNKLEIRKGQNVQGLWEITLKFERISGIRYHHFFVKMAFKVYGDKFQNGLNREVEGGESVQGLWGKYIVRMIFKFIYS